MSTKREQSYRTQDKIPRWESQYVRGQVICGTLHLENVHFGYRQWENPTSMIFFSCCCSCHCRFSPSAVKIHLSVVSFGVVVHFPGMLTTTCYAIEKMRFNSICTPFVFESLGKIRLSLLLFYTEIALTECQKKLQEAIHLQPDPKRFVPHCKLDGNYEELQCQNSSGLCWCVDRGGKELSATATNQTVKCPFTGKRLDFLNPLMSFRSSHLKHVWTKGKVQQYQVSKACNLIFNGNLDPFIYLPVERLEFCLSLV